MQQGRIAAEVQRERMPQGDSFGCWVYGGGGSFVLAAAGGGGGSGGKVAGEVREERRGGWKIHGEHSHKSVWLIIHAKTVRGAKK